jgi:glycosyltransferase involved in cell wall biosynthesis
MDLVAEALLDHLHKNHSGSIEATRICPPMQLRVTRNPKENGIRFNADRVINRFWDYPRVVRPLADKFDLFHIVDHSYGQLLHALPPERTIVTCHDADTFRCLFDPVNERRSFLFRLMMKRSLTGLQRAAMITCDSMATRAELLTHHLVSAKQTIVIHNGTHPAYSAEPNPGADAQVTSMIGEPDGSRIDLLHVGSSIPRKRIDVLLKVFANVLEAFPTARLLRVGDVFSPEQMRLLPELKVAGSVLQFSRLERPVLAAIYRRASLILMTSEREGFGLPVVEAMACGTPVIASDLDVLREVGGEAAVYCPVADVAAWSTKVIEMLQLRCTDEREWDKLRSAGIKQAKKFTWSEYAANMVDLYKSVATSGASY